MIINGLPEGHEWYEETFVHKGWNQLIDMTLIPAEFGMDEHNHEHDHMGNENILKNFYFILLTGLITIPIFVYSIRKIQEVKP